MTTDIELLSKKAGRQAALAEAGLANLPQEADPSGRIEWVRLRPFFSGDDILKICDEAVLRGYRCISLPLPWAAEAASFLLPAPVRVSTAVAFPLGTSPLEVKVLETTSAMALKNVDINVVLPVYRLAAGDKAGLRAEMEKIREAAEGAVLSFYVETPMLDDESIISAVRSAEMARQTCHRERFFRFPAYGSGPAAGSPLRTGWKSAQPWNPRQKEPGCFPFSSPQEPGASLRKTLPLCWGFRRLKRSNLLFSPFRSARFPGTVPASPEGKNAVPCSRKHVRYPSEGAGGYEFPRNVPD